MKKRIVIGNWKMNPTTLDEARRIFRSIKSVSEKLKSTSVMLCPPFVYLPALLNTRGESSISIGAQDVDFQEQGSFTGRISPLMLKDLGVSRVIIGHSERRAQGDTDEIVSNKMKSSIEAGLLPVLCIGEKERDTSGVYLDFLKNQIKSSLKGVHKKDIVKVTVAYEPLWAIGAKEPMNPDMIYEMSLFIKKVLSDIYGHHEAISTTVLYGGAVNFRNAVDIIVKGKVDGLLVGRESVNTEGFNQLLKTIDNI